MSFRIEEKLYIKKEQISEFKKFINKQNAKQIFKPRIISSLYFENSKMQMYGDSIEGLTPRKKIRVRNYPEQDKKNHNLEIKFSSVEGRYKTKKKINLSEFERLKNNGIFDSQYGVCMPKITVSYLREYFLIDDFRITIDTDINYQLYRNDLKINDSNIIIEIKAGIRKSIDELTEKFPIQRIRFSKYCNGMELFEKQN